MNTRRPIFRFICVAVACIAASFCSAQEFHDNIVVVLDASGSMTQSMPGAQMTKMDAAKQALKAVMKTVPASTHIGLLVFSAENLKDDWVYPLGPRDDDRLLDAIDLPKAKGGTPLGRYIKIGADRLLDEREKQFGYGTYRLLVVTDGESSDANLVEQYTPEVIARGITVDVIGVAMKQDHTLATKVHSYRRANDSASLNRAVQEVFAEVASTSTDVAGDEAFAIIAPLPTELATAALQTLSTSGNEPIGEKPAAARPEAAQTISHSAAPSAVPTTPAAPQAPARRGPKFLTIFMATVVIIVIVRAIARR